MIKMLLRENSGTSSDRSQNQAVNQSFICLNTDMTENTTDKQ